MPRRFRRADVYWRLYDGPVGQAAHPRCETSINREKVAGGYDILSFVSSTSTAAFDSWARDWLKDEAKLKPAIAPTICGVNKKAGDYPCRQ